MPLDATALANLLTTKFVDEGPFETPAAFATAVAEVLVPYITANAVVLPTLLIAPGGMAPAPVTGTGTIS